VIYSLLKYYFTLSEDVLENEDVMTMLRQCCGRPHIFVNVVFKPLFDRLRRLECKADEVDATLLLGEWKDRQIEIERIYKRLFRSLLESSPRVPPHDSDGTTKCLVPLLLSALLFQKGIMTLPNDQVVAEAIRCSIVPVTSSAGDSLVDVAKEPIVEAALWKVISDLAENRMEYVIRLLLSGINCQDKGETAETAFCYYVALCSAVNLRVGRHNMLSVLLAPFFEESSQQPPHLSCFTCEVTSIFDMSVWRTGRCFLWAFVREDGSYDTSIMLVNIPDNAGPDVAFLVVNENVPLDSPLRIRVVVVQLKNRKEGNMKSALLTLHPGTQYMTNPQRQYAIKYCHLNHISHRTSNDDMKLFPGSKASGIGFRDWNDYHNEFGLQHPLLCTNWIRMAAFAQPIKQEVYSFLQDFPSKLCNLYR